MKHEAPRRLVVVVLALVLDLVLGDPPNRWHPVAWMGTLIARLQAMMPTEGRLQPFLGGGVITLGGGALLWSIGKLLLILPEPLRLLGETAVLKTTFSLRGLVRAAQDVEAALQTGDLPKARHWLGWHLVSRDTSRLTESQIAAATIESLAENLSDGVVAPLFYYHLGGMPAALAYRYINTCDAMLGYRDVAREWLGKVPARLDDFLNLLPARLTAVGIMVSGQWSSTRGQWTEMWRVYWQNRSQTDSPNAGHPMSAMAGALGVELEKIGQYQLGHGQRAPQTADIRRAIGLLYGAALISLSLLFLWRRR